MLNKIINELVEENFELSKIYRGVHRIKPHIAIINTNLKDEPTQRYIRNKTKKCNEYGITTSVHEPKNMSELLELINNLNKNEKVSSIIIQYPFANWVDKSTQEIFDLVSPKKDIDRLHSCWYYNKFSTNLPLTAEGIKSIIRKLSDINKINKGENILFVGNGITTNRRLFLNMFDEGDYECRIINSKTSEKSKKELIHWSHLIISGVGKKDFLDTEGKIVISPTIIKNEDGTFSSDLMDSKRKKNITHNVIGTIGKLTVSKLILRAYQDAFKKIKKR